MTGTEHSLNPVGNERPAKADLDVHPRLVPISRSCPKGDATIRGFKRIMCNLGCTRLETTGLKAVPKQLILLQCAEIIRESGGTALCFYSYPAAVWTDEQLSVILVVYHAKTLLSRFASYA